MYMKVSRIIPITQVGLKNKSMLKYAGDEINHEKNSETERVRIRGFCWDGI